MRLATRVPKFDDTKELKYDSALVKRGVYMRIGLLADTLLPDINAAVTVIQSLTDPPRKPFQAVAK
jgi:hypothetical protein